MTLFGTCRMLIHLPKEWAQTWPTIKSPVTSSTGIYQSCPMGCEPSGREWVKLIWHLISLHGCWLSDSVSNAGRQRPGMKVAAGVCPEQRSSIQYSRSCLMLLRVNSSISKPPTEAPYKLIFFQTIDIQMSCPNIFIKAEMRGKVCSICGKWIWGKPQLAISSLFH